MDVVRFGVVGVGGMGAAHCRAVAQAEEAQLVAGAEVNAGTREAFVKQYGVDCYEDYEDLLARDDIDAITVVTPHPLHREVAEKAMRAGKHVLTEKPMSSNVADADAMIACAKETGRTFGVVFQMRFNPLMVKAKELLDSGELGDIIRFSMTATMLRTQAYYKRGTGWRGTWAGEHGGLLLNQAPHPIDVFCWLGGMPVRLWAICATRLHDMETEDIASIICEYPSGSQGLFHASTCEGPDGYEFTVGCTRGRIYYKKGVGLSVVRSSIPAIEYIQNSESSMDSMEYTEELLDVEDKPDHAANIVDFARAIIEGRPPRITGEEGLKSLEFANAAVLSSETESCITLPVDRAAYTALLEGKIRQFSK